MVLITLFGLAALPRRFRPLLLAVAAVGVVATFGRNSMLAWIIVTGLLIVLRAVSGMGAAMLLGAGLAGGALAGALVEFASNTPELTRAASDLAARLGFFTSGRVSDDSASERLTVALAALDLFMQHPLLGAGAGSTYLWSLPVSPHNQPLALAAEFGIVGLAGWAWMLVLILRGRYFAERPLQLAGAVLFVFYSMFSHALFDFAYWLLTMAMLCSRPLPAAGAAPANAVGQAGARR
jgi:O-antigen ligase